MMAETNEGAQGETTPFTDAFVVFWCVIDLLKLVLYVTLTSLISNANRILSPWILVDVVDLGVYYGDATDEEAVDKSGGNGFGG